MQFDRALARELEARHWSARRIHEAQLEALRRVLQATTHVPFYRDWFARAQIRVDSIRAPEDLWRIPVVTKDDLLAAGEERVRDPEQRPCRTGSFTTSGTSGRRLTVTATLPEFREMAANMWSAWIAEGVSHSDRILMMSSPYLKHAPRGYDARWVSPFTSFEERSKLFVRYRPTVIVGQLEGIALLARDVHRQGLSSESVVRLVFPFGQTLTPDRAHVIERGFGVEPLDLYGTVECGWIGLPCPARRGYHVPAHRVIVQVCDSEQPNRPMQPGEQGELVLTDLTRTSMPILRYRIGDRGALLDGVCPCGRPGPRLVEFAGRTLDLLVARDGRVVGSAWLGVWRAHASDVLDDFRIVQERRDCVRFQWVPGPAFHPGALDEIRRLMRDHLGDVEIIEERVNELAAEPSGKCRRVYRSF